MVLPLKPPWFVNLTPPVAAALVPARPEVGRESAGSWRGARVGA